MPDDALGRPYGIPVRREPILPNGVLGMLIFVATEIMFFSGLISAFVIGKSNAIGGWPPPGQPRLPRIDDPPRDPDSSPAVIASRRDATALGPPVCSPIGEPSRRDS